VPRWAARRPRIADRLRFVGGSNLERRTRRKTAKKAHWKTTKSWSAVVGENVMAVVEPA
jgi:hypothetical protein